MSEIDFMSALHKSTRRDYLGRVNDPVFPKWKAAELAKKFGEEYWDGDRRICYGGYRYIEGRWEGVAKKLIRHYDLDSGSRILDIGCGKGYLLYDIKKLLPEAEICGVDISEYAVNNAKEEVRGSITKGCATALPWEDGYFDLVISITTMHNLGASELDTALKEMVRVSRGGKYLCVESYRNEREKANLLYWQVTCESFHRPEDWKWWFEKTGYNGDYSFIYFE